jgi:eukaryotic-like serine/threonine-protein kinase
MPGNPPGRPDDLTRTRDAGTDMLPSGTLLAQRYRVLEVAGIGGMGVVYRALDEKLDVPVAVKILRRDRSINSEALERFRREVLLARKVSHPSVVRLHDLGQDGELLFMTMDFVQGQTLKEQLADGPMSQDQVISMAIQIAEGLAVAHRQGIVHRDLKPSNILIDENGRASIMDFGVARSLGDQQLTQAGQLVGTPAYLAPEQVRGEAVDGRTDLFALGLVLCESLSGALPDSDTTMDELLGRRASGHTPDPGRLVNGLPPWLTSILRRCLAANPDDRYPDAEALLEDLRSGQARRHFRLGRLITPVVLSTVILLSLAGWWLTRPDPATYQDTSLGPIAVMPFTNATGQPHLDWSARSMAENLSAGLAEAPGLQLIDSLRLLRLMDDLGMDAGGMSERDNQRLVELLGLKRLVSGRIQGLEGGFRIEFDILDPETSETYRNHAVVAGASPLTALPELLERVSSSLVRDPPTLPLAPVSRNPEALALYDQGLELISQDRMVDAIQPLREALRLDPDYASAWSRLAQALSGSGHYDEAVDSAQTAVELLGGRSGRIVLEAQARLAALTGNLDEAVATLEVLIERYPGDVEARLQLGENLIAIGRLDSALAQLKALVDIDPQHSGAWLMLGRAAILGGDSRVAAEDYLVRALLIENRLGNEQRRGDILNAMGIARQRLGELAAAREHLEEAVRLRARAGDRRGVAGTRANLAHLALITGDHDQAREHLAAALEEREALGDQVGMADLYNELGVIEEDVGDYRAALKHYREALRLRELLGQERGLADSYNNVAFANLMLAEFDSARQFNRAALERMDEQANPAGLIMALESKGYLEVTAGDWDSATHAFLQALDLSRQIGQPWSEAVAHGGLGLIARHQGRYNAAVEAYQRAAEMMAELEDLRGQSAYELRLAELEVLGAQYESASARLEALSERILSLGYLGHLADWHRLKGLIALNSGQSQQAGTEFAISRSLAERSGNAVMVLQAALLESAINPEMASDGLVEQAERIGHAPLILEAILIAAREAMNHGHGQQAASLARRGLRPPLAIEPWEHAWQLHWFNAHDESQRLRALQLAATELEGVLTAMPNHWRDSFIQRLTREFADVEEHLAEAFE